jgi:integrase
LWLQRERRIGQSPISSLHPPAAPKSRDRVLTGPELALLWAATDPTHEPLFGPPIRLLILLGQRLGEVVGMRATELSQDANGNVIWSLPGTRTKNGRPHTIALPKMARDILASVPRVGDLIFSTNGVRPISGWSRASSRIAARMASIARKEVAEFRLHDLRRTAATGMAELGIPTDTIEAVLNHVSGVRASVAGTYNRATLGPQKAAALEAWSQHVASIVSGGDKTNVVRLSKSRRAR